MFIGARMNSELLEIVFELGDRPLPPSMGPLDSEWSAWWETQDAHLIQPRREREAGYQVPDKQTRLRIFFGSPMIDRYLQGVLQSVHSFCSREILRGGDRRLPRDQDPFRRIIFGADLVVITSWPAHHMTYGVLKNIIRGLLDVLVVGEEDLEATFEVWDEGVAIAGGRVAMVTDGETVTGMDNSNTIIPSRTSGPDSRFAK
ncbi:hypothetical protein OEA41_009227 [Lepraria neglecta]|uniref:Uncharacterized protein n=1 Tax=Lepraria neglecta TaxID=209136 RepID=A0AAE0DK05_9LECA|nr:hypothetical protein OEA41_009227 [Lepraria neglecta]